MGYRKVILAVSVFIMLVLCSNPTANTSIYRTVTSGVRVFSAQLDKLIVRTFDLDVIDGVLGYQFYMDGQKVSRKGDLDDQRDVKRVYITRDKKQLIDDWNGFSVVLPRETKLSFLEDSVKAENDAFVLKIVPTREDNFDWKQELDRTYLNEDYTIEEGIYIKSSEERVVGGEPSYTLTGASFDDPDHGFILWIVQKEGKSFLLKFYGDVYNREVVELFQEIEQSFQLY